MRPAAVIKILGAALLIIMGTALVTPVALADEQDCINACADQWAQDKAECDQQLADRMAELDQEAQDCLENNSNPIDAALCLREVNIKRYRAKADYQRCISMANTMAYDCYRHCTSRSTP